MNQPPYPPYQQPPEQAASVVDVLVPTNPLAAVACWVGIFSLLTCYGGLLFGPIAIATGVISLKKGAMIRETAYGRGTSLARSWIGIVTGSLGTLVGIASIAVALLHHR
jgi:hypothetical protein